MHVCFLDVCQLPRCNLFTQHVIYLRRATSSELWIPVLFLYIQSTNCLLLCVYFLQTITSFHSIRLILCFQQNRWDWQPHRKLGTKFCGCVVQVSTLLLAPVVRPAKAQLVTPLGCFLAPTGSIKPWFHNWGKLAAVLIIPSSWGSQRALHQHRHQAFF